MSGRNAAARTRKAKAKARIEIEKGKPRELGADSQVRKDSAADRWKRSRITSSRLAPTYIRLRLTVVLAEIQSDADRASDGMG